jgi:hypothetical protein
VQEINSISIEDEISDGVASARQKDVAAARAAMADRDDAAVTDAVALKAEREIGDTLSIDAKTRMRSNQTIRGFDLDFSRHQAEMGRINKARPPSVETAGFKLVDWQCQCCAKSFRTLRAKEFCSEDCTAKGPPPRKSICEHCGEQFTPKRFDARFCSQAHQKAARRKEIAELSRTKLAEAA